MLSVGVVRNVRLRQQVTFRVMSSVSWMEIVGGVFRGVYRGTTNVDRDLFLPMVIPPTSSAIRRRLGFVIVLFCATAVL